MINPGKVRWASALFGRRMALPWLTWYTWNLSTLVKLIYVYGCTSLLWTGVLTAWTVVGEDFGCFPVFNCPDSSKNALMWTDRGFSKEPFFTDFVPLVKYILNLFFINVKHINIENSFSDQKSLTVRFPHSIS